MDLYISIPITGHDINKVREKADLIKARYSKLGNRVVTPFDICAGKDPTYGDHLAFDLRAMMSCDRVLFCAGWEQSMGCCIEHDTAMRMKSFAGRHPHARDFQILYEV